jgi:DNA-binding NtrC family response regulator
MPQRARTTRRLEAWLKDTGLPLFVLNAQRRLVFFNHGCERLTGWKGGDVLGQVCDYAAEPDMNCPAALLAALAPPPAVWKGTPESAQGTIPRRDEEPLTRMVHFYPLTNDEADVQRRIVAGVVAHSGQHDGSANDSAIEVSSSSITPTGSMALPVSRSMKASSKRGNSLSGVNAILGVIGPVPVVSREDRVPSTQRLHAELAAMRQAIRRQYGSGTLIGKSPSLRRAFSQIKLAQSSMVPMLFVGESGVGKQHLARVMHYQSPLAKRAFVPIDCRRAATENLDALLQRLREDLQADVLRAGTVYFDHLNAAPADFQRSVLEWFKSNLGIQGPRVLAGSTCRLEPLIDRDEFSRELYFALSTLVVDIAPLRERLDDLEPLAQHFLEELNRGDATQVGGFTDDVWHQFRRYNWPGNSAELRAVIVESRAVCSEPLVDVEHLPFRFRTGLNAKSIGPSTRPRPELLDPLLERIEREQIELALVECRHNKARAAELLGINRPRLYRRMEALGVMDLEGK